MKHFIFPLLSISLLCFYSCTQGEDVSNMSLIHQNRNAKSSTFAVSIADIHKLISLPSSETRATTIAESDLEFYIDSQNDTLFYIVDHAEGGWTMYASDKRVPAIVAHSDSGTYAQAITNEGLHEWICSMAADMKTVKATESSKLNIPLEEQESNKEYWDSFCDIDKYLSAKAAETRSIVIPDPSFRLGHYEVFSIDTQEEFVDEVNHITQTRWHQGEPYNHYCPYNSAGTKRCPAGCVAIAGAQMLRYLHYAIGVPQYAPTSAYCIGNKNSYSWGVSGQDSTIWDSMPTSVSDAYNYTAAPLITEVGHLLDTDYDDEGSGAKTEDLPNKVFAFFGISCTLADYNAGTVMTNLQLGKPVIARARARTGYFFPNYTGHCFIIDGYREFRTKTTTVYVWVYDEPQTGPYQPTEPVRERITVTYSTPHITNIRMNWGWGSTPNDTWFVPTDDWVVNIDDENLSLAHSKKMIYNFNPIQQ